MTRLDCRNLSECNIMIIQLGNSQASNVYIKNKLERCNELGVHAYHQRMSDKTSEEDLLTMIKIFNMDKCIDGIMVQLPLPPHIDANKIINSIDPKKDIGCDRYNDVYFDVYCKKCKYCDEKYYNEPCHTCLNNRFNLYYHKPVKYEEK